MIKRTLEVSQQAAHLALQNDQLVLKRERAVVASFPCEDIGVVVVDHPQVTYTHAALSRLAEAGAVIMICGRSHLPSSMLIPLAEHTEVVWRIHDQIGASQPTRKRIWQQIVRAKIIAQAQNLVPHSTPRRQLIAMARSVKSGDAGAHESQAARRYWASWLDPSPSQGQVSPSPDQDSFRRDQDGDGLNAFLNYGYAILRAAVARAIVSGGLQPALGIQHSNRSNPFCLADDLMEPLRPLVDRRCRSLWRTGVRTLDPKSKACLLQLLSEEVFIADVAGPLMVALHRYIASYVRCLRRERKRLDIPRPKPITGLPASPTETSENDDHSWN